MIAKTPVPPYYAVIFSSQRREGDDGYAAMAKELVELAAKQEGFLGAESVRDATGAGITVSYWSSRDAILKFKAETRHVAAQNCKELWYESFGLRVCKVERDAFL